MHIQFSLKNNEQILLRADALNYELCRIKVTVDETTGATTETWAPFKYFASLSQALSRLLDMMVRTSDAKSLTQLIADLAAARKEICSTYNTGINL